MGQIIIVVIAFVFMLSMCSKMCSSPSSTSTGAGTQTMASASMDYEHDLTERCKDWIYNRNRAYKFGKEGDQKGAEQARIAMLTFDRDLRKYFTEKQISEEIARLEASGYKVGF